MGKQKIFCFINSGKGTDWQNVQALCEDGRCLAGHVSSNEGFARHDIGMTSDWKHDHYKKHCPDGYELVWVDDPVGHVGLNEAYKKNQLLSIEAKKKEEENQPSIKLDVVTDDGQKKTLTHKFEGGE